jgi:hypothetical protein
MITKQETADFINSNIASLLTSEEIQNIKEKITPALASVLIKLLGDVSMLIEIRDTE